jgi:hypothetical protein
VETPLTGCLVRVVWLFGGIATLCLLLVPIVMNDSGRSSMASIGYWIVLGMIVVARYLDVAYFAKSLPKDGAPATLRDANHFNAGVVVIASGAWVIAHAL